jgi:cobalt-zinc-cadmium efflux system outer membrane protein
MARWRITASPAQRLSVIGALYVSFLGGMGALAQSAPPTPRAEAKATILSLDDAVAWALQNNPELAAQRQQHGIAAAAVIIARTYPFNPVWEAKIRPVSGPESAGITNRVSNEHKLLVDVEVRGQGKFRRLGALAALSRTDWEIAHQEVTLAIRVIRAYGGVLYRQEKMELIRQTIRVNEDAVNQVEKLVKQGKLRPADLIVIETEAADARAQLASGDSLLVPALYDLRRALGFRDGDFQTAGSLVLPVLQWDAALLTRVALDRRADLHARQAALDEAEARFRLTVADRFGNPNLGPAYEYDPTRINLIGAQFTLPLPIINTHRGEIQQRQAESTRALYDLRQTEEWIRQDIQAALARLDKARAWVDTYRKSVLPGLENALQKMTKLFLAGEPGVDIIRLIDSNRKLLRARDTELDARWELFQAYADLAASVGDPNLVLAPDTFGAQSAALPPAQ